MVRNRDPRVGRDLCWTSKAVRVSIVDLRCSTADSPKDLEADAMRSRGQRCFRLHIRRSYMTIIGLFRVSHGHLEVVFTQLPTAPRGGGPTFTVQYLRKVR